MRNAIILCTALLLTPMISMGYSQETLKKAGKCALTTAKIGSHVIEIATGVGLGAFGIWLIPDAWDDLKKGDSTVCCAYAFGSLSISTLIINGIRGLKHEYNAYCDSKKITFFDRMRLFTQRIKNKFK